VYRIVRSHHGEIIFDSKPGETAFQVRLPLKQPKAVKQ
jgi:nitrogen-specific signal transduction histidine kinase